MRLIVIRRVVVSLVLLLWFAVDLCPAQGEPVLVRFQPKVGDHWTSTFVIDQKTEMGTTVPPVVTEIKLGYTLDVVVRKAVSPDSYLLEYSFLRTRIQGTKAGITYDFDSANPPTALTAEIAGAYAVVGCRFSIVMDALGKVTKIGGIDDMQKMMESRVREKAGAGADAILQSMGQGWTARTMVETMMAAFVPLAPQPMKPGAVWEQLTRLKQPTPVEVTAEYTAAEMTPESARITFTNKMNSRGNKPAERAGAKVTIHLQGTQQGSANVFLQSGVTESFVMDQKLAGTMKVDTGSGPGAPINMVLNMNLTMRTKPVEPAAK